jgi:hypothetical protein
MFSAIVVTRTFLRLMIGSPVSTPLDVRAGPEAGRGGQRAGRFVLVREEAGLAPRSRRRYCAGAGVLAAAGAKTVEFSSGATFTVHFEDSSVTQDDVSNAMKWAREARTKTSDGSYISALGHRYPLVRRLNCPMAGGCIRIY